MTQIHMVGKRPGEAARVVDMPTGDQMRTFLGGWLAGYSFSLVRPPAGHVFTLWVDDEGLLKGLPLHLHIPPYGPIVGPVLISKTNTEGEEVSLTDDEAALILHALTGCATQN